MLMRALTISNAHETAGAARTRHSLRPLIYGGKRYGNDSDASRRGKAEAYLTAVIPGRATWSEPGIHTPDGGFGFRACAKRAHPGTTAKTGDPGRERRLVPLAGNRLIP